MTTSVQRLDDRLGLAVVRAGLSGRTLVTYARDHVSVRTPSRPTYVDGNTLDLVAPPVAGALAGWIERFGATVGALGARHVRLRWETPPGAAGGRDLAPESVGSDLVAEAAALDLTLRATTVLLLERPLDGPAVARVTPVVPASVAPSSVDPAPTCPADVLIERVDAPSAIAGTTPVEVDRRWHAATVLERYHHGTTPDEWRAADHDAIAWRIEVQRELAVADRATVWTAQRHGGPVGRLTLAHDRQGLAVVEDVVVHPVHRCAGIGTALTQAAITAHLDREPGARVGIAVPAGSAGERLARRLGFQPHATVWTAHRD